MHFGMEYYTCLISLFWGEFSCSDVPMYLRGYAACWLQGPETSNSGFNAMLSDLHAGYILLSICNVLLILVLGFIDEAGTKITLPQQSAYSNSPPPHTVPTYPPRG